MEQAATIEVAVEYMHLESLVVDLFMLLLTLSSGWKQGWMIPFMSCSRAQLPLSACSPWVPVTALALEGLHVDATQAAAAACWLASSRRSDAELCMNFCLQCAPCPQQLEHMQRVADQVKVVQFHPIGIWLRSVHRHLLAVATVPGLLLNDVLHNERVPAGRQGQQWALLSPCVSMAAPGSMTAAAGGAQQLQGAAQQWEGSAFSSLLFSKNFSLLARLATGAASSQHGMLHNMHAGEHTDHVWHGGGVAQGVCWQCLS